jgi:hypothetical protein
VWLAGLVIFLDMFRYLNALQMGKVKTEMKAGLAAVRGEQIVVEADEEGEVDDEYNDFRTRFSLFIRVRNMLIRQRIRAHVISGIEFMMFVFIVGPVINWIIGTTIISAVLLAGFELLLIYKLWIATKTYGRQIATIPAQASPARFSDRVTAAGP